MRNHNHNNNNVNTIIIITTVVNSQCETVCAKFPVLPARANTSCEPPIKLRNIYTLLNASTRQIQENCNNKTASNNKEKTTKL